MNKNILFLIFFILFSRQIQSQMLQIVTTPTTPPFESVVNGQLVGFDMDFLEALSEVGDGFQYNITQASWNDLFAGVQNGTFDVAISSISITSVRNAIYTFSVPYFISTHVILAKAGYDIQNAQDLLNHNVAVVTGTTGEAAVVGIFGGDSPQILRFVNLSQAIDALNNGAADCIVNDSGFLENYANNHPGYEIIKDPNTFATEFYGLMFPKRSSVVSEFDDAITTVLEDGEYNTIYKEWFSGNPEEEVLLEAGEDDNPYDALSDG